MNKKLEKPIRVLHVHGDLVAGGGQTLSREWLRASDRSEIDPYVVFLNEPKTLQESFERAGIPVTFIPGSKFSQIFALAKFIRKNQIDVVHTQSEEDRKVGHWAALLTRKPVVAHLHSEWVYFARPSKVSGIGNTIRSIFIFGLRRISETSVKQFVATSELVFDAFSKKTSKPIATIEPGVAVSLLTAEQRQKYRKALKISDDELVVVNLSRLDPLKNLDDFIKVIGEISKTQKVRGFIAGEGSIKRELAQEIFNAGLYRVVELLDAVDDPMELLGAADIFLATSTYESFGISVLEALTAGVPVVGYDLEVYDRYESAVRRVPTGDIKGLARECLLLANSDSEREIAHEQAIKSTQEYGIFKGIKEIVEIDQKYGIN